MTYRNTPQTERNRAIVDEFLAGASYTDLALKYEVHRTRIAAIVKQAGKKLSYEECCARMSRVAKRRAADPELRERQRAAIQARKDAGYAFGHPVIFADDPKKRADYFAISAKMGAAYARKVMGLAA